MGGPEGRGAQRTSPGSSAYSILSRRLYLRFSLTWTALWRVMEPCQALSVGVQDAVHQSGRGGRHVQRFDLAPHRQRDQLVAGRRHPRAQAASLTAQDEHLAARVVGLVVRDAGGVGAVD